MEFGNKEDLLTSLIKSKRYYVIDHECAECGQDTSYTCKRDGSSELRENGIHKYDSEGYQPISKLYDKLNSYSISKSLLPINLQ